MECLTPLCFVKSHTALLLNVSTSTCFSYTIYLKINPYNKPPTHFAYQLGKSFVGASSSSLLFPKYISPKASIFLPINQGTAGNMGTMYRKLHGKQIRLMVLEQGEASEPVSCQLKEEVLSTSLGFDALSYEWKEHEGFTDVNCNQATTRITRNLAEALRAFRYTASPRVLWDDAIYINQDDKDKKSRQIPLMREIYASTRSVLIWLGPSFRGVEQAFDIFPFLALVGVERQPTGGPVSITDFLASSISRRPEHGSIIRSREDHFLLFHHRDAPTCQRIRRRPELDDDVNFKFNDKEAWKAIDGLFSASYFQRSWIIQEVAVSEMVSVTCGSHSVE